MITLVCTVASENVITEPHIRYSYNYSAWCCQEEGKQKLSTTHAHTWLTLIPAFGSKISEIDICSAPIDDRFRHCTSILCTVLICHGDLHTYTPNTKLHSSQLLQANYKLLHAALTKPYPMESPVVLL